MMGLKSKSIVGLGIFCLLGPACADDASSGETESNASSDSDTTAAMTTMSMTTAMTTMSMDTGTTASMDTGTTASVDTGTTESTDSGTTASESTDSGDSTDSTGTTAGSESSDSGTTGGSGDCVDEDIGMAVGEAVASGSTIGQGDDFDWTECYGEDTGGFVGDSGVAFIGPGDSGFGEDDGAPSPGKAGPGDLGGGGPGDDYVVSWTAPATGVYTLSLDGSSYDTFLSVHAPVCGGELEECNDDCFDLQSGLELSANMGQTYFIVIDGYGGQVGNFTLSITSGATLECEFGDTDSFGESGFADTGGFIDPSATSGIGTFSSTG